MAGGILSSTRFDAQEGAAVTRKPVADIRTMNALFPGAELEARRVGQKVPGAEHLVLAALELPEGSARRSFESVGADPGAFQAAIVAQRDAALRDAARRAARSEPGDEESDEDTPAPAQILMPVRTSPTAQAVFKEVVDLVRKEKAPFYGAYIVMVAAGIEQGTTARALRSMGVDLAALADATRAEIDALEAADD